MDEVEQPKVQKVKKSVLSYYDPRYAALAKVIMDKLQLAGEGNALFIPRDKLGVSVHTACAMFQQGANYLIEKVDKNYASLRRQVVARATSRDVSGAKTIGVLYDWVNKELNLDDMLASLETVPSTARCVINREVRASEVSDNKRSWDEQIIQFLENSVMNGEPLLITGLRLTEEDAEYIGQLVGDADNIYVTVTENSIKLVKSNLLGGKI